MAQVMETLSALFFLWVWNARSTIRDIEKLEIKEWQASWEMKFKDFINNRKLSWTIVGLGILVSLVAFGFLPLKIPMHFNASGIADDYSNKIQIFLFPLIQLMIMFLTGREKIKYCLTHSRTFLNDFQYNWIVSSLCFFIFLVEITIIYIAL